MRFEEVLSQLAETWSDAARTAAAAARKASSLGSGSHFIHQGKHYVASETYPLKGKFHVHAQEVGTPNTRVIHFKPGATVQDLPTPGSAEDKDLMKGRAAVKTASGQGYRRLRPDEEGRQRRAIRRYQGLGEALRRIEELAHEDALAMPGPLRDPLPPAEPLPPIMAPLTSERLEDFDINAQTGDQMHLPGGRVMRAKKGYISERHGGERKEHRTPYEAAQHLALTLKTEPHERNVERHAMHVKSMRDHHAEVQKHVQHERGEAAAGAAALPKDVEEGLFDRFKHPRGRTGEWVMSPEMHRDADYFAATSKPGMEWVLGGAQGPRIVRHADHYTAHGVTGKSYATPHEAAAALIKDPMWGGGRKLDPDPSWNGLKPAARHDKYMLSSAGKAAFDKQAYGLRPEQDDNGPGRKPVWGKDSFDPAAGWSPGDEYAERADARADYSTRLISRSSLTPGNLATATDDEIATAVRRWPTHLRLRREHARRKPGRF